MAAPKQNSNALRWTPKRVRSYLSKIMKAAGNPKNIFLGKQLVRLGLYKNVWAYWKHKFEDNEAILDRMALIETMFEANLFGAAISCEISPSLAIRCLRNAHGWRNNPNGIRPDTEGMLKLVHSAPAVVNQNEKYSSKSA